MRKKLLILSVIGLILVGLLGATYAYYTNYINETEENISAGTANLGSLITEGNIISLVSPEPSDSASNTTYTVTSSNDTTVSRTYTLSLEIDSNTFVNTVEDLQGNATTQNGQLIISVIVPNNVEEFTFYEDNDFVTYNSTTRVITIDVTNSSLAAAGTYQLLTGVSIEPGETQEYGITFQFKNLESYNQSDNMGRIFRGGLIIENDQEPDIIPGYTELAYLQSSGHQYIQLNYGFDKTDEVVFKSSLASTSEEIALLAPLSWNDNNNRFYIGGNYNTKSIAYGNISTGNTRYIPSIATIYDQPYIETYKNYIFTCENSTVDVSNILFNTTTANLKLFYGWNKNTSGKVYYYKHIKGDLMYEFIPCIRKSDSKPGMCDKVTQTFFTNQGTGEFGYETLDGIYIAPQ